MKLYLYDCPNPLNSLFLLDSKDVPFLGTTLLNFVKSRYTSNAPSLGREVSITFDDMEAAVTLAGTPQPGVFLELPKERELVIISSLFEVPIGDLTLEDVHFVLQSPGKLFKRGDFYIGYLDSNDTLNKEYDLPPEIAVGIKSLNLESYLPMVQHVINNVTSSFEVPESVAAKNKIYGTPICLSERVTNSTICSPSIIGPDAIIVDSYVAPGSIILGKSYVGGSDLFGSVIYDSSVQYATVLDTIVSSSNLKGSGRTTSRVKSSTIFPASVVEL